jgi:predicted RecB family endonuclease
MIKKTKKNSNNLLDKSKKELAIEIIRRMPNNINLSDIIIALSEREDLENALQDAIDKSILTKKEVIKRLNKLDKVVLTKWMKMFPKYQK